MLAVIQPEEFTKVFSLAVSKNLIDKEDTTVIFFNKQKLKEKLLYLKKIFPNANHTIAIKSNPLTDNLKAILDFGFGLEAASFEEVLLAKNAGAKHHQIVFDSPVKTKQEIEELRKLEGIHINANSLIELERLVHLDKQTIGLRVNPLIDTKSPEHLSVSKLSSKFGVPINLREEIIAACVAYKNVTCLHIHIGSQMNDFQSLPIAVRNLIDLATEINEKAGFKKITKLDIGGGFPVNYQSQEILGMEELQSGILEKCPDLFNNFSVTTEFGRFPNAHTSWAITNIEYVLDYTIPKTLLTHVGADGFVREIYSSAKEEHRKYILDGSTFEIKRGDIDRYQIAGPLCFGGDFLSHNIQLPKTTDGDKLVIADIGANTFSLWSRHCSRAFPKVISYSEGEIYIAKQREQIHDIKNFWG